MTAGAVAEREFTVEEANRMLPELSRRLERIRRARRAVLAGAQHLRDGAALDGGGAQGRAYLEALRALGEEVRALTAQGIVLRDADSGLVDFPSRREGKQVFLCWRLGEERVAFWHGPDSGFAGRRPI